MISPYPASGGDTLADGKYIPAAKSTAFDTIGEIVVQVSFWPPVDRSVIPSKIAFAASVTAAFLSAPFPLSGKNSSAAFTRVKRYGRILIKIRKYCMTDLLFVVE
jgi:hypothetical protein